MTNTLIKNAVKIVQNSSVHEIQEQIEYLFFEPLKNKLGLNAKLTPDEYIYEIYLFCDIENKRKLKYAIYHLVLEWRLLDHRSTNYLCNLAILSANIGLSTIAPRLYIVIADELLLSLPEEEYIDSVSTLIATLDVFLPDSINYFKALFYSDTLEPNFIAQLFLGLCKCDPTIYYRYIPRFLHIYNSHSQLFHSYAIFREFLSYVPLENLVESLEKIEFELAHSFLKTLCGGRNALIKIIDQNRKLFLSPLYQNDIDRQDILLPSFGMSYDELYNIFFSFIERDLFYKRLPVLDEFINWIDESDDFKFDPLILVGDF